MPGPSLNSSPVCQGVAVLLIIITVCKSICKSHTALGLLANANAAHAHLLEGQLYTFLLIPCGEWEECVREGLRAARGHRGLDHSDRPPTHNLEQGRSSHKPAPRSGSAPARARSALSSTLSLSLYTLLFPRSLSQAHTSPHPELGSLKPCVRVPAARPRSRTPGAGRETRGKLEPTQHRPQGLSPPRAAAARVGVWIGYRSPRDAPGPPAPHPGSTGQWASMGFGEEPGDLAYPV